MNDQPNADSPKEPKIIVDEDWKSQVEREKEELKHQEQTATSQGHRLATSATSHFWGAPFNIGHTSDGKHWHPSGPNIR